MSLPFVDVDEFAESFRALKTAEQQPADWLLQVASDWIREHKPGISDDSVAAKLVVVEVVSNALRYNKYQPLRSFTEETANSSMSGVFMAEAKVLDFTDRHREMLGIPIVARPVWSFKPADY